MNDVIIFITYIYCDDEYNLQPNKKKSVNARATFILLSFFAAISTAQLPFASLIV